MLGAGGGRMMDFIRLGINPSDTYGIDLDGTNICEALNKIPKGNFLVGSATELPWNDNYFDIVTQFKVFCVILQADMKRQIAKEMLRVVKKDGLIIWCDQRYSKPGNNYSRGISKREIRELFPGCNIGFYLAVLIPQIARIIVPISWLLGEIIEYIPLMRSHYIAFIKPSSSRL